MVLALAGCGGDVNSKKAEKEIKKGLIAQTKADVKYVKCPEGVNAQKGGTFKCEALIPVTVTQVDENGNVRWQITSFSGPPAGATGATGTTPPVGATGTGATGPGLAGGPPPLPGGAGGAGATGGAGGAGGAADEKRFLTFRNRSEGYSISYVARWVKSGSGRDVIFRHPTGIVFLHVIVNDSKQLPTVAQARKSLKEQQGVTTIDEVARATINGKPAITARFSYRQPGVGTRHLIKRYIFSHPDKGVVIEIGMKKNLLDNVPLQKRFDRVVRSFRWL
jgi:uncharacterized protein DUF4333